MNILWDLDGTIVNTIPSLVETFYRLAKEKYQIQADPKIIENYIRINSEELFSYYNIPYDENIALFRNINASFPIQTMTLFPHVKHVLEQHTNFLVTNRVRSSTEDILKHWNISHYFKEVICADDAFPKKPIVDSYLYLSGKYPIQLVIGDRELDFIPAKILGILTCSFQNLNIDADFYLDTYQNFSDVIKI